MARKKELPPDGAPAYMGLFSSLMTILLCFFILLNTLTEEQDAGFKQGIGRVRNAFGMKGGFGLLNYMQMVRGKAKIQVQDEAKPGELTGTPKEMTIGKGGSGNIDQDTDKYGMSRHIQVRVTHEFPPGSARIPDALASYLDTIGTSMQLFDYAVSVKAFCRESGDTHRDRRLATKRAAAVMLYLQRRSQLPLTRMRSTGYTDTTYFAQEPEKIEVPESKQMLFLCIYRQKQPNL